MLDLLHQQELEKIDAELFRLQKLPTAEIPQLVPNHHCGVVWRLPVSKQSDVFMCLAGVAAPVSVLML